MVVGVNGTGKTTTIGKIAARLQSEGRSVGMAASDTFRAAAGEQLEVWAGRTGATVVSQQRGADPGAVAFDAVKAAEARHVDVLIVDTAGRLHTRTPLMEELKKVRRVIEKAAGRPPDEVLLVVDATTGQNGIRQAESFTEAVDVSGIVLTKLDRWDGARRHRTCGTDRAQPSVVLVGSPARERTIWRPVRPSRVRPAASIS
jgi:fused signal recognition particle receptor